MTPADTAKLRELALAATPGPIEVFDETYPGGNKGLIYRYEYEPREFCSVWFARQMKDADAQFIAALRNAADALLDAADERDREMERVKACEHIAEGDDGWEKLRNVCPSTMAVAVLRDERDRYEEYADKMDSAAHAALKKIGFKCPPMTNWGKAAFEYLPDEAVRIAAELALLTQQRDELRAALVPFAAYASHVEEHKHPDDMSLAYYHTPSITCGHLREAARVLAATAPAQTNEGA